MNEVKRYEEKWLRSLEYLESEHLFLSEHGFNYTRDDDRDDLDDSTIFNSLLKTKMYRSLEFSKGWVKLKVAESNGTYYILSYDLRLKTGVHKVFKLSSPTDNILINHIKKILNSDKLVAEEKINEELKKIMTNTLSSLGGDVSKIKESDIEGISQFSIPIKGSLEIIVLVNLVKDKNDGLYSASVSLNGLNGVSYFVELYHFENISELDRLIRNDLQVISDTIKETLRNNTAEELLFSKVKKKQKSMRSRRF